MHQNLSKSPCKQCLRQLPPIISQDRLAMMTSGYSLVSSGLWTGSQISPGRGIRPSVCRGGFRCVHFPRGCRAGCIRFRSWPRTLKRQKLGTRNEPPIKDCKVTFSWDVPSASSICPSLSNVPLYAFWLLMGSEACVPGLSGRIFTKSPSSIN